MTEAEIEVQIMSTYREKQEAYAEQLADAWMEVQDARVALERAHDAEVLRQLNTLPDEPEQIRLRRADILANQALFDSELHARINAAVYEYERLRALGSPMWD